MRSCPLPIINIKYMWNKKHLKIRASTTNNHMGLLMLGLQINNCLFYCFAAVYVIK